MPVKASRRTEALAEWIAGVFKPVGNDVDRVLDLMADERPALQARAERGDARRGSDSGSAS